MATPKNIKCPILYLKKHSAQNNETYRMLPDPVEKQAGFQL